MRIYIIIIINYNFSGRYLRYVTGSNYLPGDVSGAGFSGPGGRQKQVFYCGYSCCVNCLTLYSFGFAVSFGMIIIIFCRGWSRAG